MPPITWQNVEAPNLRFIAQGFNSAQAGISEGFKNLADTLKQETNTNVANWDNQAKNNTEKFYSDVASQFKTPEEYQAALKSGFIDQLRQQYGPQIDQAGVRKYMDERPGILMDRLTKEQAYGDAQTKRGQRDYINGFAQAIAAAKSGEELDTLRQGLTTYAGLGHVNSEDSAKLVDQAVTRGRTLVTDKQNADKTASDLLSADTNRKVAVGQLNVSRQNANTASVQAQNAALQHAAQLAQTTGTLQNHIVTGAEKRIQDVDEKKQKANKANVYGSDIYTDKDAPDLIKVGKAAGLTEDQVSNFLQRFKESDYSSGYVTFQDGKVKIPITKGLLESSLIQGADLTGLGIDWIKGKRLYNTFLDNINHKDFASGYTNYLAEQALYDAQKLGIKANADQQIKEVANKVQPYIDYFERQTINGSKKK